MVTLRDRREPAPLEIPYDPQRGHPLLPVEVVDRSRLLGRLAARELASRQRAEFHQLIVCTAGQGTHEVDFEVVGLSAGTLLRIHPGQVQRFAPEPAFEALMVLWPTTSHPDDPDAPVWYPGSGAATRWQLDDELFGRTRGWVDELRNEQDRFDGSSRRIALMQALLSSLLLRLAIEIPATLPSSSRLPQPYLDFRGLVEDRLYERPRVVDLARHLGYSTRTLDRACQQVSGQTAKQVLDERVTLEVRRLLTSTDRSVARVAADFGFPDVSNFSKFVKRHLGALPGQIRDAPLIPPSR